MSNRLLYRHPAPGCIGKTCVVEYSPEDWADAAYTPEFRALLDSGQKVTMGDTVVVDLVAHYRLTTGLDAIAGLS